MPLYKAKITNKSEVDINGYFEVTYDIYKDNDLMCQNNIIRVLSKEEMEVVIKAKLTNLDDAEKALSEISVGDEITI